MNKVIHILMNRDDITKSEAKSKLQYVRHRLADCGYDPEESESIIYEELGLELDYLDEILFG